MCTHVMINASIIITTQGCPSNRWTRNSNSQATITQMRGRTRTTDPLLILCESLPLLVKDCIVPQLWHKSLKRVHRVILRYVKNLSKSTIIQTINKRQQISWQLICVVTHSKSVPHLQVATITIKAIPILPWTIQIISFLIRINSIVQILSKKVLKCSNRGRCESKQRTRLKCYKIEWDYLRGRMWQPRSGSRCNRLRWIHLQKSVCMLLSRRIWMKLERCNKK